MFDGTLARATGQASQLGAFMDSIFDRWARSSSTSASSPGCRRAGAADVPRPRRRRGDGRRVHGQLRPGQVRRPRLLRRAWAWPRSGLMPREIRLVLLSLGIVLTGTTHRPHGHRSSALGVILVGAIITVIQRILFVRRQDQQQSTHPAPSKGATENHSEPRTEATAAARTARRRPTPGRAPAAAATARSASRSSASATARAASSRAATTTRTPTTTTSSPG